MIRQVIAGNITPLEEQHSCKNESLRAFLDSPLEWIVIGGTSHRPLLPFSVQVPHYLEIEEYLPAQFCVNLQGYSKETIPCPGASNQLNEDNTPNALLNASHAFEVAEKFVQTHYPDAFKFKKRTFSHFGWKVQLPTARQLEKLSHLLPELNTSQSQLTRGEASLLISSALLRQASTFLSKKKNN